MYLPFGSTSQNFIYIFINLQNYYILNIYIPCFRYLYIFRYLNLYCYFICQRIPLEISCGTLWAYKTIVYYVLYLVLNKINQSIDGLYSALERLCRTLVFRCQCPWIVVEGKGDKIAPLSFIVLTITYM